MNFNFLNFIIIIIYLISPTLVYSIELPKLKNLIIHKDPKTLINIEFKDKKSTIVKLNDFENKLVILNFWATWCLPCRDEMPSLDKLAINKDFNNLEIIPINVGRETINKSINFFRDINVENLDIYYDDTLDLPRKLLLRGIPTSVLINKDGKEFARILGSIDFENEDFINWLKKYD